MKKESVPEKINNKSIQEINYEKFLKYKKSLSEDDQIAASIISAEVKNYALGCMQDLEDAEQTVMSQVADRAEFAKELEIFHKDNKNIVVNLLKKNFEIDTQDFEFLWDLYGQTELYHRLKMAVAKDKHRPRNMQFWEFVASPDLEYVGGDFSTFDRNLALKKLKKTAKFSQAQAKLGGKKVPTMDEIIGAAISETPRNLYEATLDKFDAFFKMYEQSDLRSAYADIVKQGVKFDADEYSMLLTLLVQNMAHKQGIKNDVAYVIISDDMNIDTEAFGTYTRKYIPELDAERGIITIYRNLLHKAIAMQVKDKKAQNEILFTEILSIVMHEYSHHVDVKAPNKGAVGAQRMNLSQMTEEKSKNDPSERSAYTFSDFIRKKLIQAQND